MLNSDPAQLLCISKNSFFVISSETITFNRTAFKRGKDDIAIMPHSKKQNLDRKIMQPNYHPASIEQQAQQHWESRQAFRATEQSGKPKYYCLSMFPYQIGPKNHAAQLSSCIHRTASATTLGKPPGIPRNRTVRQAQILLPVDVPLSFRQAAHGACAQLHHRRCVEPLPPHERF